MEAEDIDSASAAQLLSVLKAHRVDTSKVVDKAELRVMVRAALPPPNLIIDLLSPELFCHIFSLLPLADIGRCARVCHYWTELTLDEVMWQSIARRELQGKQYCQLNAARRADILKTSNGAFRGFLRQQLEERRRCLVTMDLLCKHSWQFRFRRRLQGSDGMHEQMRWINWRPDGILETRDRRGRVTSSYHFVITTQNRVQVDMYPPLWLSRTNDWGYKLKNPWVTMWTYDPEIHGTRDEILVREAAERASETAARAATDGDDSSGSDADGHQSDADSDSD